MTLDEIAQKVVDDLEWSSSIPNIKAMVLTAMTDAVAAEREACARIADKIETDAGYAIEGLNTYGANTKAAVAGIAINSEPMAEPKEIELRITMLQTQAAIQTAAMQIASYIRSRM